MKHLTPDQIQGIVKKCVDTFLSALLAILSVQAVYYAWIVDPYDYVFYEAVEPSDSEILIGSEELFFRSFADVKKTTTLSWEDILKCDIEGDGFIGGYFSVYKSDKTNSMPARWTGDGVWRYGGDIPIQPATCTLRSTTFVVFKVFFVFDLKRPLAPIISKNSVNFIHN